MTRPYPEIQTASLVGYPFSNMVRLVWSLVTQEIRVRILADDADPKSFSLQGHFRNSCAQIKHTQL